LTPNNAAEMRGASMLRSGKNGTVRTFVPACSARSQDMDQRYASGLYRQALLTLGDSAGNLIGRRCRHQCRGSRIREGAGEK